jgi:hypothetical protein
VGFDRRELQLRGWHSAAGTVRSLKSVKRREVSGELRVKVSGATGSRPYCSIAFRGLDHHSEEGSDHARLLSGWRCTGGMTVTETAAFRRSLGRI